MSVTGVSAKRPNGCMPTPVISTRSAVPVTTPPRTGSAGRERVREHGRAVVVGVQRVSDDVHRLAEGEHSRIGLGDARDHAQLLADELDDAEPEGDFAVVARVAAR